MLPVVDLDAYLREDPENLVDPLAFFMECLYDSDGGRGFLSRHISLLGGESIIR